MSTAKPSTLIECLLKRAGGSEVEVYGEHYHFKPEAGREADPKAPHIAAIPNEHARQIHRLLSIKGYQLVDKDAELPAAPKAERGQTIHADKAGAEDEPASAPVIIKSPDGKDINLTEMERPELAQFAAENFQIKVHPKWKSQNIIAKIVEAMRATPADE
jgi:hypothetical protein